LLEIIPGTAIEIDYKNNNNDFWNLMLIHIFLIVQFTGINSGNVVIMRLLNSPSIKYYAGK